VVAAAAEVIFPVRVVQALVVQARSIGPLVQVRPTAEAAGVAPTEVQAAGLVLAALASSSSGT